MNWKRLLREYFSYNDYEKKNLIGLTILLILIICIRLIVANLPVNFHRTNHDNDWVERANATFSISPKEDVAAKTGVDFLEPDSFINLNHVKTSELESLGLTKMLAQRFISFRNVQNAVYSFETKEDFFGKEGAVIHDNNLIQFSLFVI